MLYLPGYRSISEEHAFKTKLVRIILCIAGKREKGAGTELNIKQLDCVAGVCIVKRDVVTMVCQTLLQTPKRRRGHLNMNCCSRLGKCATELGHAPDFCHETSL